MENHQAQEVRSRPLPGPGLNPLLRGPAAARLRPLVSVFQLLVREVGGESDS